MESKIIWVGPDNNGHHAVVTEDGRIEPARDTPSSCVDAMIDLGKAYATLHRERDALRSTLRDTFAAAALPAVISRGATRLAPAGYAREAYAMADAMLAAREEK